MTKQLVGETLNAKGRGLIALADFSAGEVIAPIDGVQTWGGEEILSCHPDTWNDYSCVCQMGVARFRRTDPVIHEVGWHLANHSCSPNAKLTEFLLAERRIAKGEEISVSYGWVNDRAAQMTCLCGSHHCYGTVGPRVRHLGNAEDAIIAWREFVDAMIVSRNMQALQNFRGWFDQASLCKIVETVERERAAREVLARSPKPFNYDLSVDRMESLSF